MNNNPSEIVREKTPLFHFHHLFERRSYRCWLHFGQHLRKSIRFETSVFHGLIGAGVQTLHGEWTLSLKLGVWGAWFSFPAKYRSYGNDREICISFSDGALRWSFWTDPMSWSSSTPFWRHGSLNFVDLALGRSKCEHRVIESQDVLVPMPERSYRGKAELAIWEWRRPRWFKRTITRVSIEMAEPIPFPGKGENSWDCGDDATHSITTGPCNSIAEGVGILVGSVLRDRVRYGGWSDWKWLRAEEPA